MSITALVFILIYIVGIILTLHHPVYGVALYFFEWHNHPPYWWWGEQWPDPRWSFLVAVLIVVSLIINRKKLTEFINFQYKPLIWLILLVANSYLVSLLFAINPAESLEKSEVLLKLAINYFLIIYIIRNPKDYRVLIFIIILCVANFGRIAWEEGSNRDLGIAAPGATEGNLIALYIMTTVPFYAVSFLLGNRWMKVFLILSIPFVLNALILENSRGTILGLLSMAALAPFFVKGKLRFRLIIGLIAAGFIFIQLTNDKFWERQTTTLHYQQDNSAMSRLYLAQGAYRFLQDYPFGGGGDSFAKVMGDYVPELKGEHNRVVHNTYLNTATDWGYLGLLIYLGFIFHSLAIAIKIKKDAMKTPDFNFFNLHAVGLLLCMTGTLVAFTFYSRLYSETLFWYSSFVVVVRNMQLNAMNQKETSKKALLQDENAKLVSTSPQPVLDQPFSN